MTIDIAKARAAWESVQFLSNPLPYIEWAATYARPLLAENDALREALKTARRFVAAWPRGMPVSYRMELLLKIDAALAEGKEQ